MSIIAKLHAIRLLALAVEKSGQITGGINAKFASYADIREALNPHLVEHGLSLGWKGQSIRVDDKGREIVTMHGEISDGLEVKDVAFEVVAPAPILNSRGAEVVNNAQRIANAASYCVRIATLRIFGMGAGNEDECERMAGSSGGPDQRDSAPQPGDNAHWSQFLDGEWGKIAAPGGGTPIGDLSFAERTELLKKHPTHAGLIAWVADSLVLGNLNELGMLWSEFTAKAGGNWPDSMVECTPDQIKLASKTSRGMLAAKPK